MAKRSKKNKSKNTKPNIPDEVLARVHEESADDAPDVETADADEIRKAAERRAERAARRAARKQQQSTGEKPAKRDELGAVVVAEMLANPTTTVDEEELKVQYSYVISDLRNMGILAAILLVVLLSLGFAL
ncbi:MAG: hypothetical protein AAF125_27510 [Chloroflexota bacterium]